MHLCYEINNMTVTFPLKKKPTMYYTAFCATFLLRFCYAVALSVTRDLLIILSVLLFNSK